MPRFKFPLRLLTLLSAALLAMTGCQNPVKPGEEVKKALTLQTTTVIAGNISSLNDTARFLAGMPGGADSPLTPVRQTEHWQRYSRSAPSGLHRACGADIARGALRLWSAGQEAR